MIDIKIGSEKSSKFEDIESAMYYLRNVHIVPPLANGEYKDLCLPCGKALFHPLLVKFLKENKHLRGKKICLCEKGCDYSKIQYIQFPITRYNDGTTTWGKHLWCLIHTVAKELPKDFWHVLKSLQYLLPCIKCRINFCKEHKGQENELPINYAFNLHNKVSEQIGNRVYEKMTDVPEMRSLDVHSVLDCIDRQVKYIFDFSVMDNANICTDLSCKDFMEMQLARDHIIEVLKKYEELKKSHLQKSRS